MLPIASLLLDDDIRFVTICHMTADRKI